MNLLLPVELSVWEFLLFAVVGIFTGIINTIAGSGSLLTLPVFIFICGLPPSIANGTNRIGVLMQSIIGSLKFNATNSNLYDGLAWMALPSFVGAIIGSRIAVDLNEQLMKYSVGTLMVLMLIVLLLKPEKWLRSGENGGENKKSWGSVFMFFIIGIYGGFLQAGVGIFLLASMVLVSKFNLKQANALKLFLVMLFTIPSLLLFFYYGKVHLLYGLLMGIFQGIGAWLGVKFIARIPNSTVWIYRILVVVVAVSAIKFFI